MTDMPSVDRDFQRFAQEGDLQAFTRVYEATATKLLATAVRLVRDAGEAEELVQQTFVSAIDSASRYDATRPVEAWLAGILANLARRTHRRRNGEEIVELEDRAPGPALAVADRELREAIFAGIDGLAEPYRSVAVLNLRNGLDPAEVAYALGRPPATVRSQLSRAKQMLRSALPAGTAVAALCTELTADLTAVRSVVHAHAMAHAATLQTTLATTSVSSVSSLTKTAWITMTGTKLGMGGLGLVVCLAVLFSWDSLREARPPLESAPVSPARIATAAPDLESDVSVAVGERVDVSVGASEAGPRPEEQGVNDFGDLVVKVTTAGNGWAGVAVQLSKRDQPWTTVHRAVTDPIGEAVLADVPAGVWWLYTTCDATPRYVEVLAEQRVDIALEASDPTWIQGLVVDELGAAVPGAEVWSAPQPDHGVVPFVLAESDAVGAFRVPVWNIVRLGAKRTGYWSAHRIVHPSPGAEQRVQLTLRHGGASVHGLVVDLRSGRPVPDALVAIETDPGPGIAPWPDGSEVSLLGVETATSSDGTFDFDGLVPGPVRLAVESRDHARTVVDIDLVPDDESELRIELFEGATVSGTVFDVDGRPAAGAEVSEVDGPSRRPRSTVTDDSGRYRLSGLAPGRRRLRAESVDRVEVREVLELEAVGSVDWSPRLQPGADSITGSLRDQQGAPLTGWTVVARSGRYDRGLPAKVDSTGAFELGRFRESGTRTLRAHPPGGAATAGSPETAAVQSWPGIEIGTSGHDLVVNDDRMPTAWLRGRVDRSGLDRGVGAVFLQRADGSRRAVRIERDGSFEIGPLAPGEIRLSLPGQPEQMLGSFTLSPRGDHDVGLLHPEGLGTIRMSLTVDRPWEELRGKVRFQLVDFDRGESFSIPIWQNPFDLRRPAGSYRLQIVDSAFEPLMVDVDVVVDEVVEASLDPAPCALTTVRVEPERTFESLGRLLVQVTPTGSDQSILEREVPPFRGGWTCRLNLPPGSYRFQAGDSEGAQGGVDLTIGTDPFASPRTRRLVLR